MTWGNGWCQQRTSAQARAPHPGFGDTFQGTTTDGLVAWGGHPILSDGSVRAWGPESGLYGPTPFDEGGLQRGEAKGGFKRTLSRGFRAKLKFRSASVSLHSGARSHPQYSWQRKDFPEPSAFDPTPRFVV